jgi:hypothetical protein
MIPSQQIVDLARHMALNDGGEHGGQPSVRIDAVHFACLDDGPVFRRRRHAGTARSDRSAAG